MKKLLAKWGVSGVLVVLSAALMYHFKALPDPATLCMLANCGLKVMDCVNDPVCYEIVTCMKGCDDSMGGYCVLECGLEQLSSDPVYQSLQSCMVDNQCIPKREPNGICLAKHQDAMQNITQLDMVKGDWWVVKGQNCGQDEVWSGGYDGYPCQHNRFTEPAAGSDKWFSNTTFCTGANSVCKNDRYYVVLPDIYFIHPGVVRNDYPFGSAPLLPQIEDWYFVSYPHADWALVIWCGYNPVVEFHGALVVSRQRTLDAMPAYVESEFRRVAKLYHMDYDAMCVSDNTNCQY